MRASETHAAVQQLFVGGRRTTRIGVEHELVVADVNTDAAVPINLIRAATRDAWYAPFLGFEPGGQAELSLPPAETVGLAAAGLAAAVAALRADVGRCGIRLLATPVDRRPDVAVPLQLTSDRYVAMQRHFDAIGPSGRRMMRQTASTQACLDWWPGRTGLEQWQVLNLAGPYLAAAFARSSGPGSRLATWLAVDPDRTAFDDRLVTGDDPVEAYADFARGAAVFVGPGDVQRHLSTLFPPVRPRGCYLEVRFLDVQPVGRVAVVLSALAGLLYDDERRGSALRRLHRDAGALGELWQRSAQGDAELVEVGRELAGVTDPELLDGAA